MSATASGAALGGAERSGGARCTGAILRASCAALVSQWLRSSTGSADLIHNSEESRVALGTANNASSSDALFAGGGGGSDGSNGGGGGDGGLGDGGGGGGGGGGRVFDGGGRGSDVALCTV